MRVWYISIIMKIKIVLPILFGLAFSLGLWIFLPPIKALIVIDMGEPQRNWREAAGYCRQHRARLAHIQELLYLYWSTDFVFTPKTDYWSQTQWRNRALGINTRFGILSYDKIDDEDHAICVQL